MTDYIVAVSKTNMVGTDEVSTQTVGVFDAEAVERRPGSMHEVVRPVLEDRYGNVEDLRCHPTSMLSVDR